MGPIFQRQVASFTLIAFASLLVSAPQGRAEGWTPTPRALLLRYSEVVKQSPKLGTLELARRMGLRRAQSGAAEIYAVLDRSSQVTRGNWVRAVNENSREFNLSALDFSARVRFSEVDPNLVTINGRSFVLNEAKSLQENVDVIARALASETEGRGVKIVRWLERWMPDSLIPQANAMSGLAIGLGIAAVVGVIVAIVAIVRHNKKKKADEAREARDAAREEKRESQESEHAESEGEEESESTSEEVATDTSSHTDTAAATNVVSTDGEVAAE